MATYLYTLVQDQSKGASGCWMHVTKPLLMVQEVNGGLFP